MDSTDPMERDGAVAIGLGSRPRTRVATSTLWLAAVVVSLAAVLFLWLAGTSPLHDAVPILGISFDLLGLAIFLPLVAGGLVVLAFAFWALARYFNNRAFRGASILGLTILAIPLSAWPMGAWFTENPTWWHAAVSLLSFPPSLLLWVIPLVVTAASTAMQGRPPLLRVLGTAALSLAVGALPFCIGHVLSGAATN